MKYNAEPTPRKADPPGAAGFDLRQAVEQCRRDEDFLAGLRDIYRRADSFLASLPANCRGGGACCKFDLAGHLVYLSTGELALLTQTPPPQPPVPGRCAYQVEDQCAVYDQRTLGCRLFFCDSDTGDAFQQTYEAFHEQLRSLHRTYGLPYRYVELTAALGEIFPASLH